MACENVRFQNAVERKFPNLAHTIEPEWISGNYGLIWFRMQMLNAQKPVNKTEKEERERIMKKKRSLKCTRINVQPPRNPENSVFNRSQSIITARSIHTSMKHCRR